MKTNLFFNFHRNEAALPVMDVLYGIKDGQWADSINSLRDALSRGEMVEAERIKKALPGVTFSAIYNGRRIDENISHYNGVIILDIDKLDVSRVQALKVKATIVPHTLFCFCSPGGRGLKIGVLPVLSHPVTQENHRETFKTVQTYYEKLLKTRIDPSGKDVGRLCFVSYDPEIYINPRFIPFMKGERPPDTDGLPLMDAASASDSRISLARKYTTRKMKYEEGNRNNYLFLFANNCNRLGIPPDEVMRYCRRFFVDISEEEQLGLINSAYSHTAEHNASKAKEEEKRERCVRIIEDTKKELKKKYTFRFNVVTNRVEWRTKGSRKAFIPIDDLKENSIWCELQEKGIPCKHMDLHAILTSDFSERYDPFKAYFLSLPAWDGKTDYIGRLADTVQTTNQPLWHECLRKWLVALVACALYDDAVNHTVLLLSSEQGLGKTKWCCNLVPPELRNYRYSGVPNIYSKDSLLTLSECILINLDEMEAFSAKELSQLKEIITKGVIRARRAYGRNAESYIRRASFTASVNNSQVLTDLTGARRFLCFEAKNIDYMSPVDYANVYAQAVALLNSGYRYWFDSTDINRLNVNNEDFRVRTPEEELFYTYFRKPDEQERDIKFLSSTEILEQMCRKTNLNLTYGGTVKVGMMLKKEGFERKRKGNKYVFAVIEIPVEEVDDEKKRKPRSIDDNE